MTQTFHASKKFLNKDGFMSDACIFNHIRFNGNGSSYHDISLKISDCRESIYLDLTLEDSDESVSSENSYENSIHKVNVLISELALLKSKMQEAKVEYDNRVKKNKEEEEAKKKANENNQVNS